MAQITTAELALELDATPRDTRKFLRSADSGIASVGKGSRYAIEKRDLRSLKTRFAKWDEARRAVKADNEVESDTPTDD